MGEDVLVAGRGGRPKVQRARQSSVTRVKRQRFLDIVAATGNVMRAAREIEVTPSALYRLRGRDHGFAQAWDAALDASYDRLESALLAKALGGGDGGEPLEGDADRAGVIDPVDQKLALDLLARRDAQRRPGVKRVKLDQRVALAEVEEVLVRRLRVLTRSGGSERK